VVSGNTGLTKSQVDGYIELLWDAELERLDRLLDEEAPLPALHALELHNNRRDRLNAVVAAARQHPVYRWLKSDPSFRNARLVIEKQYRVHFGAPLRDDAIELLRLGAICAGRRLFAKNSAGNLRADRREIEKAIRLVKKLHRSFDAGVQLSDPWAQLKTEAALLQFEEEMRDRAKGRQPKSGLKAAQRATIEVLGRRMQRDFGFVSPTAVQHLADLCGHAPDKSTVKRRLKAGTPGQDSPSAAARGRKVTTRRGG
jgi:hypothetical protein